jgi:hypothetical protein
MILTFDFKEHPSEPVISNWKPSSGEFLGSKHIEFALFVVFYNLLFTIYRFSRIFIESGLTFLLFTIENRMVMVINIIR